MADFILFLIAATFVIGLACAVISVAVAILRFIFEPIWAVCQLIGLLCCIVGYIAMLPYVAYKDIRRYYQNKRQEEEQITFQEQVGIPIQMEVKSRRRKKKVVNIIQRNGVYVPENGEW
jgi:hypothetical protein